MKLLAALVALVACAHGPLPRPARAGDPGAKLVSLLWYSPTRTAWQQSPWYRYDVDVTTPVRIAISTDAYGCILDPGVNEPKRGDYWVCVNGWRWPQHRGNPLQRGAWL